jgi:hypothetical protein
MKRNLCVIVLIAIFTIPLLPSSNASTLLVKIDCGNLQNLEDEEGKYILFNPTGKVSFIGNRINYRIYFSYKKNTPLSKQSYMNRVSIFGGAARNITDDFNVEHKFRNSFTEDKYYLSKYLEFTITAKVSSEPTVTSKCIYKRR